MPAPAPWLTLLLLSPAPLLAQQVLYGKIRQQHSDELVPSATVYNISLHKTNISDLGGNYRISARPGDTVVISSAGYRQDTTFVAAWMFQEKDGYIVYLDPNAVTLPSVRVGDISNYQLDSMKRKEDYEWLDHRPPDKLVGDSVMGQGFGIAISPLTFFSRTERTRRRLRKRLRAEEQDYYVDFRFSRSYVAMITGLKGDSLQTFMIRYRPGYTFCRKSSNEDILLYINDKLKEYHNAAATKPRR